MGVCHTKSHVQATGRGIRTEGMLRTGLPRPTLPLHEALPTLRPCPVRRPRPPAHTWRPKGQGGAGPAPSRAEGAAVRRAGWQRPNSSSDCPSFPLSALLLRARGCPPALGPSVSSSAEGGDNPTAAGALQRASNDGAGGARPEGGRRLPRAAPLRPEGHRRLPARSAVGAPGFEPGSADSHAAAGAPLPAALPPALLPAASSPSAGLKCATPGALAAARPAAWASLRPALIAACITLFHFKESTEKPVPADNRK